MSTFVFSGIRIIQSLGVKDRLTGDQLRDWLHVRLGESDQYRVELFDVYSKLDLFRDLEGIASRLEKTGFLPMIQFETDGNESGLSLASGELVPWWELKPYLARINTLCGLNLLVVGSACFGESLSRVLKPHEPAPVWGCIGPVGRKYPSELKETWEKFYDHLVLRDRTAFRDVLKRSDIGLFHEECEYRFWPAEWFFLVAFRAYVENHCSDESVADRVDDVIERIRRRRSEVQISDQVRAQIASDLSDWKKQFLDLKPKFFMEEMFPGNSQRFPIEIDEQSVLRIGS